MTLVIVGHDLESMSFDFFSKVGKKTLESRGLFVASDSVITAPSHSGRKTLLAGFRKSYAVPVKLWEPYFVGLYFQGYKHVYQELECFVAFAGGTLTAQHVLNSITEHLGNLRITFVRESAGPGEYKVIRHCQKNILEAGAGVDKWDESMFLPKDYEGILTADVISEVVKYSISESLSSAKEYKLDPEGFEALWTEFAVGIYCPSKRVHRLFVYRMRLVNSPDGLYDVKIDKDEVPWDEVAVLGMRKQFEIGAQVVFDHCVSNGESPTKEVFDYLNYAIDVAGGPGCEIDRPSILKVYKNGRLNKEKFVK